MREEVVKFSETMEKKLSLNEHKGGWDKCSIDFLTYRLRQEQAELFEALRLFHTFPNEQTKKMVQDECADVGNFSMMIHDLVEKQLEEKQS